MSTTRLLTLRTGGWLLVVAALLTLAIIVWAVAPAMFVERPPGDGRNIESYGFDLSNLTVPRHLVAPALRTRDMVPVMDEPVIIPATEVQRINDEERGKFLVPSDRIVGVVIGGEARAYPLALLNVHEVIHDTLGPPAHEIPIAVTYSWHGDCVRVFDRRVDGKVVVFGASGLFYNANSLYYDRPPAPTAQPPFGSLWSQATGRAISGSGEGLVLEMFPAQLASWSQWLELHPESSVVARDPHFIKRYRRGSPDEYFRTPRIGFPVEPLPARASETDPPLKERVIVVEARGERRVYPVPHIAARAFENRSEEGAYRGTWTDELAGVPITFDFDGRAQTILVLADEPIAILHNFWFLWHAMQAD